jgi:TolB-like protein
MAADIVGYSAQMGNAEESTINSLRVVSNILERHVTKKDGRLFSQAGDGFMSEFSSPVSAVRAAFEIQREINALYASSERKTSLRIGVHIADVVVDGDNLLGDGINIASRVESVAEPGSVMITEAVFDLVKRSSQLKFENCGTKTLKNISDPILLYKAVGEISTHSLVSGAPDGFETNNDESPSELTENSIAVLPFANMSNDSEQEYFADGFSDDLITELSRFRDLFVISRNASFTYKGRHVDVRQVGKEMGVVYCLEGSVRKMGSRVRINAQLILTHSGDHIWAEKYDFNFDEVFDVQDELASTITSVVAGRVSRRAEGIAKRKKPSDMEAYDCLLHGLEHHRLGGVTREDAEQAYFWFGEAIKKDPQFGRAYAWKSCALAGLAEWTGDKNAWDEVFKLGAKGIEMDDEDAECHRIAGSLSLYNRKYEKAKFHFNRALELNPNHAFVVGRIGELYNFLGEPEKALEYQLRARRLDPFLPEYCRELEAVACYLLEHYQQTLEIVSQLSRKTRRATTYGAAAAVHLYDQERISDAANSVLKIDPDFSVKSFLLTEFYKDREARDRLEEDLIAAGLPI